MTKTWFGTLGNIWKMDVCKYDCATKKKNDNKPFLNQPHFPVGRFSWRRFATRREDLQQSCLSDVDDHPNSAVGGWKAGSISVSELRKLFGGDNFPRRLSESPECNTPTLGMSGSGMIRDRFLTDRKPSRVQFHPSLLTKEQLRDELRLGVVSK